MKQKLDLALRQCLTQLIGAGTVGRFDVAKVMLTRPTDEQFGDYTTNIALMVAKEVGMKPRDLAELITQNFSHSLVVRTEIAGPGHINFYLSDAAYTETLKHVLKDGERYGSSMQGDGEKVNNEFISANLALIVESPQLTKTAFAQLCLL